MPLSPQRRAADVGVLGRLLSLVAGAVFVVLAFMFSLVALAVIVVLGLLAWLYFRWKTRGLRRAMRERPADGHVIDGEAVVVAEETPERPRVR